LNRYQIKIQQDKIAEGHLMILKEKTDKKPGTKQKKKLRLPFINKNKSRKKCFKPHINVSVENENYIIKIVENKDELEQVFKLRYEVFYEEINKKKMFRKKDVDKFDYLCDHLVAIEKESGKLVGTYRFNSSLFNKNIFYSSTEFSIKSILELSGNKLELGRACILKDYRNNLVIAMLWRGLREYVLKTESKYLFGCSSIKSITPEDIVKFYILLKRKKYIDEQYHVPAKSKFRVKNFNSLVNKMDSEITDEYLKSNLTIPPLLRFYIKAGACICGEPAIDRQLHCTDYFTLFNMDNINENFTNKLLK